MTRTAAIPNPALASIQQSLQRQPLNASRSFKLDKSVYGLHDGAPILRSKQEALLPRTGIQTIDKANEQVTSITQFGKQAVGTTIASSMKGSLYGAIIGLLIGLLGFRNQFISDFVQMFKGKLPGVPVLLTSLLMLGGLGIGGFLGFMQSVKKNIGEGRKLLLGQVTGHARRMVAPEPRARQ